MNYDMPINTIQNEQKLNKIDKIMCYLCIIDILFLPYIRVVSASISMVLLPIWFLFNLHKIKITKELKLFFILLFFMILSFLFSIINYSIYIRSNIINLGIVLYGFLYYFFFRFYFKSSTISLKKILILYITFALILSIIYLVNAGLYFQIRSFWTMSGNAIEVRDSLAIHRFTSTFSDPNNASIAFVTALTFLLFNTKLSQIQSIYVLLASMVIIIASMSSTGIIAFAIILILLMIKIALKNVQFDRKIKTSNVILIILTLPFLYLFFMNFIDSDVVKVAIYRISGNSADSRFRIWIMLLNNENIFKYILYGMGGTIILDGSSYKPHNGHFHLIYSYGMIAYTIFMYIFFRLRKGIPLQRHFFLIPIFIGFTMNVGIYEPRFMNLLVLLVASISSVKFSNSIRLE